MYELLLKRFWFKVNSLWITIEKVLIKSFIFKIECIVDKCASSCTFSIYKSHFMLDYFHKRIFLVEHKMWLWSSATLTSVCPTVPWASYQFLCSVTSKNNNITWYKVFFPAILKITDVQHFKSKTLCGL